MKQETPQTESGIGLHVLDQAIALEPKGEDLWRGRTHPEYANFIGPYGGVTAAQLLQAVLLHPQRLGEPVAFTINFAAAVADGGFDVRARPARTNRSTQHWVLEMLQDGQAVATGTAMTALRRETWGATEAEVPRIPAPQDLPREAVRGVAWVRHYERRYAEGNVPAEWNGQGGPSSRTRLWLRDTPDRPLDFASLTAMADNFFPRLWLRRATQVPIGTVSMTVYFHADAELLRATGTDYVLAQAQGQGFRNGYLDQTGQLWNRQGDLLATTHQLMYFKE
ncbi:acyl-CoA thioesterase [Ramlibacter sp. Leaf400]|uniref:acyl-CoA thioesterase n=1 Tax=Ramlibacter sp. Leaf400 TaxID=1736365 RepID=UPI000701A036|nr:thioesterase family protein [Ramlibacter sp. Leaf400]KQT08992.1 acyl-CoA thioesterase [Ramlibacter sp. Leaf400]